MTLKFFLVFCTIPTNRASKSIFFSIFRMLSSNLTSVFIAPRQLLLRIFTNIISRTLSLMTVLTKMRGSPAEPRRDLTAKFALVLNKIFAMFRTVGDSRHPIQIGVLPTNTILRIETFIRILVVHIWVVPAFSPPREIRLLTHIAHIITQPLHRKFYVFSVSGRIGVCQARVFVQVFEFKAFKRHIFYFFV